MTPDDFVHFLQTIPPFKLLTEAELHALARSLSTESYARGAVIVRQDTKASDALRIIRRGGVRVSVRSDRGEEMILDHRGEGDTFGLVSLMSRGRQMTTVTALEETTCYVLSSEKVRQLIEANASFTEYFLQAHFTKYVDTLCREMQTRSLFYGSSDHLLFTTPVGDVATKDVVTVRDDATIREAALQMSSHRITSLVIVDRAQLPVGVVTDRDLREKVVSRDRSVDDRVRDIMSLPLIRVDVRDYCFEALLKMLKHNVDHILVIREGQLKAVLTNHDLMLLQGTSPLSFARDLESQDTVEGLVPVSGKINRLIGLLLREGAQASNIARIVAELNDRLVRKVLELAERKLGRAPVAYCWLAYGTDGRREQALAPDQNNGLVYEEPADAGLERAVRDYFEAFTPFVAEILERCGIAPCPQDHRASNSRWRQPLRVWKEYFSSWIGMPALATIRRSRIFFDLRPVAGDPALADELRAFMLRTVARQSGFFAHMADAAVWNRPPLGLFRSLIPERKGEHKNTIDLRANAVDPIVDIVRLLALESGVAETSTLDRIEAVRGRIPSVLRIESGELVQAFEFMNMLCIRHQVEQQARGDAPDTFIDPRSLRNMERSMLRESFQLISRAQEALAVHYGIGLVRV